VVDIGLIGTFHVIRAVYPNLTKPGAAVINISAPQSFIPVRCRAGVCAAKAGRRHLLHQSTTACVERHPT
jgi:NAD(P)-dependent dehydrogenase (short-subunit alcohol dehydrogenase family)